MKHIHEGLLPANSQAEELASKGKTETTVTKENIGGLRYVVYIGEEVPEDKKVVSKYDNKGNKVK